MQTKSSFKAALTSQVGRKILTGITGVLLVIFIITHLLGNLQLLYSDPTPFNTYGLKLQNFGVLLYIIEILLGLTFLLHAYIGVAIYLRKRKARKQGYEVYKSKGGPSKQSVASRTMIITGIVLLVFLVIHLIQFRFGATEETMIGQEAARNLHLLVMQTFSNIGWVIFYVGVTLLLGFHLRHGIWSALQSLSAMKPSWSKGIYSAAFVLGALLALGFVILPVLIYVRQL